MIVKTSEDASERIEIEVKERKTSIVILSHFAFEKEWGEGLAVDTVHPLLVVQEDFEELLAAFSLDRCPFNQVFDPIEPEAIPIYQVYPLVGSEAHAQKKQETRQNVGQPDCSQDGAVL